MIRAYGLLLLLYPKGYRASFETEMKAVFAQAAESHRERGRIPLLRSLFAETAGAVKGSAAEWFNLLNGRQPRGRVCVASQATLAALPANIAEAKVRVEANLRRMEHAIANHQFPSAPSLRDRPSRARRSRAIARRRSVLKNFPAPLSTQLQRLQHPREDRLHLLEFRCRRDKHEVAQ